MTKYDDLLAADEQDRQRQVTSVGNVASRYNPDQYAQAIGTSSRLGVPASIIANNPQAFDRPNKYSQILDQDDAPTTQEWLTNFDNAAVAQDDVESLSGLERALRLIRKGYEFNDRATQTLKDAGRQAGYEFTKLPGVTLEGAGRIYEAFGRYTERGLRALGGETAANIAGSNIQVPWYLNPAEILKQPGQTIKEAVEPIAVPEERQNLATDIGGGLGQLTGQALTAILTGGASTTVTLLSQGADIMGERAENAGATPEQTDAAVLMGASITALTERYGLDALLNRLPPQIKNAFLRRLTDVAVGGGIEAAQEAVEGVLHNLTAKAIFDPDAPIFEGIEREALAAGGSSAIARAIIGAITPGRQVSFADQDKQVAEQIAQAAQQSKLSTRSPQKLEELVSAIKEQTGSEFAYVDAAAFRTLYQSDQEAAQAAAELTGSTQTYFEAAVSNTKLAIPLEKYVSRIAANKNAQALIDHVTFTPDGLTAEEAKAERELFEGRAKEIADREVTEARPDSSQAVYDDVLGQLLQTGMERSTAERNAALTQVVFRTLGQRTGLDAQDLYRRYGLKIRRDMPGLAPGRVEAAIDPLLDRIRKGDVPSEQQAFGLSLLEFIRSKGGLKDDGGELAARDIDKGNKAFQRNIIQKDGMTLDDMAEQLVEAGYIQERDPNLVLDLISRELSGSPVYAERSANVSKADLRTQAAWIEEMLSRAGIDIKTADNETIKKALDLGNRGALLDYLPTRDELTEEGLSTVDDAFDTAMVARAASIDEGLVERLATQYADDESGFITAIREFLNEQDAATSEGGQESAGSQEVTRFSQNGSLDTSGNQADQERLRTVAGTKPAAGWATATRIRGKSGRPLRIYRGSQKALEAQDFTDEALGKATGHPSSGLGVFFTTDQEDASRYGEVAGAFIDIRKPKVLKIEDVPAFDSIEDAITWREKQKKAGFDGLVISSSHLGGPNWVVAFDANQVIPEQMVLFQSSDQTDTPEFKRWFGDSKVVDEQGRPLVVYHGTNREFDTFKVGSAQGWGRGIYLTDNRGAAEQYGDRVVEAYVSLQNPFTGSMPSQHELETTKAWSRAREKWGDVVDAWREDGQFAGDALRELGYDGVIQRDSNDVDGLEIVAFEPTQIKSAIGNRGTFDPNNPSILFQSADKELIIQHSITEEKLLHAMRMGGIAVPSLAITKKDQSITGFGDITLLGPSEMAQPSATTKVFGADIYSPRYPSVEFRVTGDALKKINEELAPYRKEGEREIYSGDISKADDLNHVDAFKRYAEAKLGKATGGYHEMRAVAEQLLHESGADERIFQGFTNSGNRRYIPHTIENVVKILKKELRGGEGFNYGVGSLRAKYTPQFKSVAQIRKAKGRLVTEEQFKTIKEEIDKEFFAVAKMLAPYYKHDSNRFDFSDIVISTLEDAPRFGLRRALQENQFNEVDSDDLQTVVAFLEKLRNLPTGYFETKILRPVSISEFAAAVVPSDTSQKVYDLLESRGIEVRTYTRGDDADRLKAVSDLATDLEEKVLFQRFNETKRGAIQFGADRQFTISLLEKADLSTFLHESGHFYLEILADLAEDPNAPQQIKDDFAKVLKWMKVKSRAEIGVEQHEQWARGFEAYLMEGKAPSVELQSVFARFRAWLVSVYKTLTRLNVELTDEVRGVMDRLVATDEEIQAAEESQNYAPIFTSAEQAGMSPEEWAAYQNIAVRAHEEAVEEMTDRAMKQLTREQKAWWKEERAKMVEAVTAEVNAQPVYRALAFLQKGQNPDGSALPEGVQAAKLHKDALVDRYGKDFLKRLPRGVTAKEGINPDLAAPMFDFDSGDALVEALANARPKAQLIEMEADARMRDRYGDMLTDGSITDVAMKSVHTEGRTKVMAAELKALNRKRREVKPFVKAAEKQAAREQRQAREANAATLPDVDELKVIKAAVQRIIQTKKVREIQPNLYRLAEAKAARKAFDLAGKGKFEEAYIEKRRQILNHELYRAAVKAREEVDSIVEYMRTFDKRASRERLGKAGGQYLEQIDAIRERFDFSNVSNIADLKRTALAEWVAEQRAKGLEVAIPDSVLNEARRTPYKELLLAELQGLHDAVKNIDHLSRLKNKLLSAAAKRDFDDTVTDVVASIDEHHKRTPEIVDFAPRFGQKLKKGVKRYFAEHTKMEFLFSWLDGEKDLGSTWTALFKPIADAENVEQAKMRDARAELTKILSAYDRKELSGMFTRKVHVPEVSASFTRASLLSVALNSGNEYNREVLLRGYGWNEAQLTAILSKLDNRDWDTVEAIWEHIDSYWPDVAALQKDLTGLPPEKVEAMPFLTPSGRQVRGGYYPLKYDSDTSERQNQQDEAQSVTEMFGGNFARIATRQGHTKARTDSGGKKVKLDLGVYTEHVTNVIHDLAFRRAVLDVDRLIQDSRVEQAIIETAGREMYRQLRPWLRNIAADYRQPMNTVEKILNHARAGASIVSMGFKITTAIVQPLGYLQSVEMLGAKYAGIGLKEFYGRGTPQSMARAKEFVFERSEQMRNRMTTFDRDVRDQLKGLQDRSSKIRRSFFFLTGAMDMTVSLPTWLGAYRKAMDGAVDGINAGDELAAIDFADSTVRKSQSAGGAKDLAGIQSGHPLFKLFTTFYSYFNVMYNLMARRIGQTKSAADIPQLVSSAMLLWFLPAILSELIAQRGPDDDEEWGEWFAENWHVWGFYPLQGLIGFRELVQAMGPFGYDGPPALDAISQTGRALTIPVKALDEEQDVTRADVKSAVLATSYWGHLPGRRAWITGEYMYDYMTGEVDEFSVRDALFARPRE